MVIFVLLYKIVMEEQYGIKIHIHANVLPWQCGTEDIVWQIHVWEEFGMLQKDNVSVLRDYNLLIHHVEFQFNRHVLNPEYLIQMLQSVYVLRAFLIIQLIVFLYLHVKEVKLLTQIQTNVNANMDLFSFRIYVEILHVLKIKDGMDLAVFKLLVLLIHITMELNVFVQIQKTIVNHGNIMMELNAFINQDNVLKVLHGMELFVFPITVVLQDFIL